MGEEVLHASHWIPNRPRCLQEDERRDEETKDLLAQSGLVQDTSLAERCHGDCWFLKHPRIDDFVREGIAAAHLFG